MTVRQTANTMTKSLQRVAQRLDQLPQEAFDHWVRVTPRRSGNAQRRTVLRGNTISAEYPYAHALEAGASRQAPRGMSEPTERFIRAQLRKKMRK